MNEIINAEEWLKKRRKFYANISPDLRPKKNYRSIKRRSEEKSAVLAWACYNAWQQAMKSGFIEKIPGGYKICPEKKNY